MTQRPLHICYPFVGDTVGGSHLSALGLIRGLPAERAQAHVVVHQEGPFSEMLRRLRVPYAPAPVPDFVPRGASVPGQVAGMVRNSLPLARYLRRNGIDVVHTNDMRMHLTWGPAARVAGACFIWHQRSAEDSRRLGLYAGLAHRVLTVSQFTKAMLPGALGRRAEVVLNPFDARPPQAEWSGDRERLLAEMGAPASARIVGYVANLSERKRPLVFVEMAARLRSADDRPLVFPMFGEARPPFSDQVEALIRERGLEGSCRLMGLRYPMEPLIAACDVVVAPAVAEPFGRAIVEPTLVGTPVVAADDGGNREILTHGETGLLVRPDDPQAFAEAVARLLDDNELAERIARAAREMAQERFSSARHVADMLARYRACLE
jgi:glycosyltransferase involved in cell wall biosynthesis